MASSLSSVVEEAYTVFSHYRPTGRLHVCFCPCCFTPELEAELRSTPLRSISSRLLSEYTNSAHAWEPDVTLIEVKYFLPRYFELVSQREYPSFIGPETCLSRLGQDDWRATWPSREVAVIDRFFAALVEDIVSHSETIQSGKSWSLADDVTDVLIMLTQAGGSVREVLDVWDQAADPAAAAHFAAAQWKVKIDADGSFYFDDAFLSRDSDAAREIGAFLRRAETLQRMSDAFFSTNHPGLQQILSDGVDYAGA